MVGKDFEYSSQVIDRNKKPVTDTFEVNSDWFLVFIYFTVPIHKTIGTFRRKNLNGKCIVYKIPGTVNDLLLDHVYIIWRSQCNRLSELLEKNTQNTLHGIHSNMHCNFPW